MIPIELAGPSIRGKSFQRVKELLWNHGLIVEKTKSPTIFYIQSKDEIVENPPDRDYRKSSMLEWWPKIKDLGIPMPETSIIEIPGIGIWSWVDKGLEKMLPALKEKAHDIGYPLFLRTDQCSAKHSWKNSCFVSREEDLEDHIYKVLEFNHCVGILGLPVRALVFRKYIEMDNHFLAFHGDMPINPERRFFIRNGKVQCHHFYWTPRALAKTRRKPADWMALLAEAEQWSVLDIDLLYVYAKKVAQRLHGYWSVDFCRAKDGTWYLIDMAEGNVSWHAACEWNMLQQQDRSKLFNGVLE